MKIAVLTSGILPVPASLGGAIETLIDHYLAYNEEHVGHEFCVFSVKPRRSADMARNTTRTRYRYIDVNSLWARMRRRIRTWTHQDGYYNYFINDFYHCCLDRLLDETWDAIILENRPGYAIDLRRRTKARIILHQHFDGLNPSTWRSRDICRSLDLVIGVSDYICRCVQQASPSLPVQTVYNGIDVSRFSDAKPERREDFGLSADDFVIVYSGRIDPIKGIRELVSAVAKLAHLPHIKLLIIGGSFYGGSDDNDFVREMREIAKPLLGRIVFTGFVPYDRVPSLLKMADLAVLPSTCQEAFALTVVEAMAAGIPVLTTRSGGVPETCMNVAHILEQGPDLDKRLAAAIAGLMADPAHLRTMSAAGVTRAARFSHEAYARAFLEALKS